MTTPARELDLAELSIDDFSGSVDNALTLVHGEHALEVTLASLKSNPNGAGPDSRRTPFSLILRADEDPQHPIQGIRELTGDLRGLPAGIVPGVMVVRVLRPVGLPPGVYYQVGFS